MVDVDYLVLVFETRARDAWQWGVLDGSQVVASGLQPTQEAARTIA